MKVYISCDMEGISGIVHVDQTRSNGQDYPRCRELMTEEVNAAALGAFDAGAKEVLINDSHGDMRSIIIEKLDPRVQLISGNVKPLSMVQGVEGKYDAAFFVGYHAGMGAKAGILDHTYYGAVVSEVRINGKVMNEAAINALIAGSYGTPVVLVTGDDRVCEEAKELLDPVETVTVKWAITRYSARSLHPKEAQRQIREAAARALKNISKYKPFVLPPPYTLHVKMLNAGMVDNAEMMPGVRRVDALTLEYRTDKLMDLFKALLTAVTLGSQSIPQVRPK